MHLFRSAERVLGLTCNQLTLKNNLNDAQLYENIVKFKQNYGQNVIDEQWTKVSTFISLLYAKALNINENDNPILYWKQKNGLLKKQIHLANALALMVDANNLSILEYNHFDKPNQNSYSTRLYFKSLDQIKQLNNERIYSDLKQSIDQFHQGLKKWSKLERNFFDSSNNDENDQELIKLTFDNYSDYVLMIKDQNHLFRNWEDFIQSTYANVLGFACSSMALLGDHNFSTWKQSFDFGSNFAFNYIVNQQFKNYLNTSDDKIWNELHLPILMHLKSIKNDEKRKQIIDTMHNKRFCSSTSNQLKIDISESEETVDRIRNYSQIYLNQTKNCLNKLKESDSKNCLLNISHNHYASIFNR